MVLNSISGLLEYFPEERLGIERYVRLLNEVDTICIQDTKLRQESRATVRQVLREVGLKQCLFSDVEWEDGSQKRVQGGLIVATNRPARESHYRSK